MRRLLLLAALTAATMAYCGTGTDRLSEAREQGTESISVCTQADSAIRIGQASVWEIPSNEIGLDQMRQSHGNELQKVGSQKVGSQKVENQKKETWKQIVCDVEDHTTLVKAKPKPKPPVLLATAAASRGGEPVRTVSMSVPAVNTSFKTYMDYRCITNHRSKQWELQQNAYTNQDGFRMIGGDYLVALGTFYTSGCGERFLVTLSSGKTITVMTGDVKSNAHTNGTRQYCPRSDGSGNMLEFIIDQNKMSPKALRAGNLSCMGLEGTVVKIEKIVEP